MLRSISELTLEGCGRLEKLENRLNVVPKTLFLVEKGWNNVKKRLFTPNFAQKT